jgi:hypothetical protein
MHNVKKFHLILTSYLYWSRARGANFGFYVSDCLSYQAAIDWVV